MSSSVSSSTRCTLAAQSAKRCPSEDCRSIGSYALRGGPNRSTNFEEYDRLAVVWNSKYSGASANAPSAVGRINFRTWSAMTGRP